MKKFSVSSHPVISILLVGLIIRILIAIFLYSGYDEAYYYIYTKNLDWSYFDHPVLVSLITGFGVWITGEVNQFTIRIGTLIIFTFSLYLLYLTSKNLWDKKSALFTLIIASTIPIFTIGFGVLTLPDTPLIFFWTLTLYWAVKEFFKEEEVSKYQPSYRIIFIAISIGLACLSKYHGFILGLGLVGFCLFNYPYRKVFISPWLLGAIISFLLILSPLLYWNIVNDWASFSFQLSGRFQSSNSRELSINLLNILLVALTSIGYLFPTFGFPLWWISGKTLSNEIIENIRFHKGIKDNDKEREKEKTKREKKFLIESNYNLANYNYGFRLILWVSLPLTFGFTFLGGVTQILPTWPMPGFWGLTIILGHFTAKWFKFKPKLIKNCLYFSFLTINTIFLIILLHLQMGLLQKPNEIPLIGGIVTPKNDPSTELIDIVQLRNNFLSSPDFMKSLEDADFIFTNQYFLGGYIGMAVNSLTNIPVTCFSDDNRGFDYWYPNIDDLKGKKAIYITTKRFEKTNFQGYFEEWKKVTEIPLRRGGEITETFIIYQGKNLINL